MTFDPVRGRMLDPQTGQEIDQVHVDRNDVVRGGAPAIERALAQGGAYFFLQANQSLWQNKQLWEQVDTRKLSWLQERNTQTQVEQARVREQQAPRQRPAGWTLNRFVPGAPAIAMPRMRDCPDNKVSPLSFALSEIGGQLMAASLHEQLTNGVDRIAFFQNNYRGSQTLFQFG